jgi:hypothetical protein
VFGGVTVARYFVICNLISFIISFLLKSRLFVYLKFHSVKCVLYGFNLKMLKYIKSRHVGEEEESENESKLSEPSTSKAEKDVTGKKSRLYDDIYLPMGFAWTGDENCPLPLCTVCGKETYQIRLWSRKS